MGWTALPSGDAVAFKPGYIYAVVASVKANHSRSDILALVAKKGLRVFDYAEEGQRAGLGPDPDSPSYRAIALQAVASSAGSVPWSVPWPLSMADSSSLVHAWESPPGAAPPMPAALPSRPIAVGVAGVELRPLYALGAAVVAGKAWQWWRGRRRRR